MVSSAGLAKEDGFNFSSQPQHGPAQAILIGLLLCALPCNQGLFCDFLRIFAAIQYKCLSMNNLHSKPGRFRSISFKVIQGNSRYFLFRQNSIQPFKPVENSCQPVPLFSSQPG
jgi:hypothetical protein